MVLVAWTDKQTVNIVFTDTSDVTKARRLKASDCSAHPRPCTTNVPSEHGWCTGRLDSWESEQNQWTATLTVLQHFQALIECESSATAPGTDMRDSVAVKKRKIDANNKNYVVANAGVELSS